MRFKTYLNEQQNSSLTEKKITHLDHLEDLVFLQGYSGAEKTIKFIKTIYNDIHAHNTLFVQQKVDGAPSVIAGTNPENGKFFVATKSLFNKTPKINYTNADIEANHGHAPGLMKKLKLGLEYFPRTIPKGTVLQGDFMFDSDDLEKTSIDGVKGVGFEPNTIYFFVPAETPLYKKITTSKVGIIWHTVYTGNTIDSLSASFNISDKHIKKDKDVYVRTPMIEIDKAGWSKNEEKRILSDIAHIETSLAGMNKAYINEITSNETLKSMIMIFMNDKVKTGHRMRKNEIKHLFDFIEMKYEVYISKYKSDKGKAKKRAELEELKASLNKHAGSLYNLFTWVYYVEDVKNVITDKMNKLEFPESPYMKQADGSFQVTDPEGFVVSDGPNNVKFINRAVFSKNNFMNMKF